ncbi:MAG: patatin-like phospholipase family protein [Pseudomonadales bacterium]
MHCKLILLAAIIMPALVLADNGEDIGKKVGLVLSGGGARGLAHIGIIQALEDRDIEIYAIVGTSMGAVIGALYASGRTPAEIEKIALDVDWSKTFDDDPSRNKLSFRRKQDSRSFPAPTQAALKNGVLSLPRGAVQGQNLQLLLQKLFLHVSDTTDFDELPIPFRAVAGDLVSGDAVTLSEGSLATAVRASMSIPGFYAPVEMNGQLLADGGIAKNLPVDVLKEMGVDRVIAVNIATPLYDTEELDSIIPIVEQLTTLLTAKQVKEQYALITDKDILIKPDLADIHTTDFHKTPMVIQRGYKMLDDHSEKLATFSTGTPIPAADPDEYAPPVISEIKIDNNSNVSDKLIRANINQQPGDTLDREQLEEDLRSIYGYEYFESVNYEVVAGQFENNLIITAREKSWGNDLLGVNFELFSDSHGKSAYNLGAKFRKSGITAKGGEWLTLARIGNDPLIRTQLYAPLDYRQIFFIEPYAGYSERDFNKSVNSNIESRLKINNFVYGGFLGIEISNIATVGTGIEANRGRTETFIGVNERTDHFRNVNHYWQLEVDTLDSLYFPHSGTLARIRYDRVKPESGADPNFELLRISGTQAFGINRHSLILTADYVRSFGQISGTHFQQSLGGFLNLSGFRDQALAGNDLGYAGITYLHRLTGRRILPLDVPAYVGASLEAGNVWPSHSEASIDDLIGAGAIFVGADSPLGGLYLGYGRAEGGQSAFYLKLGRLF